MDAITAKEIRMTRETLNIEKKMIQRTNADCVVLLDDNLLWSIPANFLCFLIVFVGLYHDVQHSYLLIWFIAGLFSFILHGSVFIANRARPLSTQFYLRFLVGLAVVYGSLWGISGSVLMPYDHQLDEMLVIIMSIGVASAGLHTFQPNMTASILFPILIILPLSIRLFLEDDATHVLLGMALLIYCCFMLMVSWKGHKLLNTSMKLRYENVDLVNKLVINNIILEESESRFRAAFDFAAIGMAIVSLEGKWLKVNQSLCQIVGYSEEELLELDFQTITHPDDLELDLKHVQQLLAGDISFYHMEKRYIQKNGNVIWILLSGSLIRNKQNKPLYFIAQIQDIDAQKHAERELTYIAHHDVLTGLSNRKQLDTTFEVALSYAKRHEKQLAILFIDLDHFKTINDMLGHDIGDCLLIEIGARLKTTVRATDLLIRQGGDEFIIVLTEIPNSDSVVQIAKEILKLIAQPLEIKSHKLSITASIGISMYPKDGQDLNMLMMNADKALYIVKAEGRNNFRFFAE